MVQNIVAQCVANLTSLELTSDTNTNTESYVALRQNHKTLMKYLSNFDTVDIAYTQLMNRAEQHRTNTVILLKCVQFIKDNLNKVSMIQNIILKYRIRQA